MSSPRDPDACKLDSEAAWLMECCVEDAAPILAAAGEPPAGANPLMWQAELLHQSGKFSIPEAIRTLNFMRWSHPQ